MTAVSLKTDDAVHVMLSRPDRVVEDQLRKRYGADLLVFEYGVATMLPG